MVNQRRVADVRSDEKGPDRAKPRRVDELGNRAVLAKDRPGGPIERLASEGVGVQTSKLGDARLQGAQRRQLASHIGRAQGNLHLQRMVAALKGKRRRVSRTPSARPASDGASEVATEPAEGQYGWAEEGDTEAVKRVLEPTTPRDTDVGDGARHAAAHQEGVVGQMGRRMERERSSQRNEAPGQVRQMPMRAGAWPSQGSGFLAHRLAGVLEGKGSVPAFGRLQRQPVSAMRSAAPQMGGISRTSSPNVIHRWSGHEHLWFGDYAAEKVFQHTKSGKSPTKLQLPKVVTGAGGKVGVAYGEEGKKMTLGKASELSGDHRASPKDLATTDNARALGGYEPKYLGLATTNIDHFFPLAASEWHAWHAKALASAQKARTFYAQGTEMYNKKGDEKAQLAIRDESFGLHFLQDSYASGHQYPRALNAVDRSWVGSGIRGLTEAKTYHDALCALPRGLDLESGKKVHGDDTLKKSGDDVYVAEQTYNSLAQVFAALSGQPASAWGAKAPRANYGPDVGKIMKDPEAGPIWYSLEHSLNEELKNAKDNKDGTVTTDSGLRFRVGDIIGAWESRKGAGAPELSKNPDLRTKLVDAQLRSKAGGIVSSLTSVQEDNAIVDALTDENGRLDISRVPRNLTVNQTVLFCERLISGACVGSDEDAVLLILMRQSVSVFRAAVERLTPGRIDSGLDWRQWDAFLLLCANRYTAGSNLGAALIRKEKNDDAARMLINGGLHGEPPVTKSRLSPNEWIGAIEALLSGACTDADENAIVAIVRYMASIGQAGLVNSAIGKSKMDAGVDGRQWNQVRGIMRGAGYNWSWW